MNTSITIQLWQILVGLGICLGLPLLLAVGMGIALKMTKGETGPPKKPE